MIQMTLFHQHFIARDDTLTRLAWVSTLLPKSLEFTQNPIKIGKIYLMAQFSLLTKAYVIEGVSG